MRNMTQLLRTPKFQFRARRGMIPPPVYPPKADQSLKRHDIGPEGRKQVSGMTLIELLVVMAILVTVTTSTMMIFRGITRVDDRR